MAENSSIRRLFRGIGRSITTARVFTMNLLFVAFVLIVLAVLVSGGAKMTVPDKGALVIAPEGTIVEQTTQSAPFEALLGGNDIAGETRYQDLIDALDAAKKDSRIAVIVLDLEHMTGVSPAHLSGLGDSLAAAKAAGKEIVAVGDYYTQGQYYLASFADSIYMHSMGQVLLTGFGSYQSYYKDLLDKLKVKVHVFRVGAYKAAVEPYTRTDMSPEAREANRAMIDELWQDYIGRVATNRKLPLDQINEYVLHYEDLLKGADGDMARVALEHGLVDALISRDEMRDRLIAKVGESEGTFRQIASTDYLRATRAVQPRADNEVGVVVASGMILPGEQPRGSIGADSLTELIRNARLDQHVKAVVLRVDSPGGAAISSEVIRQELEQLQISGKPLVVSMAGVAASGGYWISATADEIWAAPTTVTGSIGIFGMVPTFEDSLAAIGVTRDGVASAPLAGALDPFGGISEPMGHILQANVEAGYKRFLDLVSRGRDMLPDQVDKIGQGRVWTGRKAKELGLVDGLGQLPEAVAAAAKRAGMSDYQVRFIEKPLSAREQLLQQLAGSMGFASTTRWTQWARELSELARLDDPLHTYALCDACSLSF
jgi:protease IV